MAAEPAVYLKKNEFRAPEIGLQMKHRWFLCALARCAVPSVQTKFAHKSFKIRNLNYFSHSRRLERIFDTCRKQWLTSSKRRFRRRRCGFEIRAQEFPMRALTIGIHCLNQIIQAQIFISWAIYVWTGGNWSAFMSAATDRWNVESLKCWFLAETNSLTPS